MRPRHIRSTLLVSLIVASSTAPSALAAEAPVKPDGGGAPAVYVDRDGNAIDRPAARLDVAPAVVGPGYTTYDAYTGYPELRTRQSYTLRLVANGEGDVEAMRAAVQLAAANVAAAGGASVTVAPGTLSSTDPNLAPAPGEILLRVSNANPCDATLPANAGCGGPVLTYRQSDRATVVQSGRIWFKPFTTTYSPSSKNHLVAHELGHALGLRHHDAQYQGLDQVMHSTSYAAETYRAGDDNGFAYLGQQQLPTAAFTSDQDALWAYSLTFDVGANVTAGVAAGTSPSIATLTSGETVTAYQTTGGQLRVRSSDGTVVSTTFGMARGTSPSIASLPNGGWVAAFQSNVGQLWTTTDSGATVNTQLGMTADSSPSIATTSAGGWFTAIKTNGTELWVSDDRGGSYVTQLGLAAGTSPSIATTAAGGWVVAFNANGNSLWVTNDRGSHHVTQLGVAVGTSPSIATKAGGGWVTAFHAFGGRMWIMDDSGSAFDTLWGMKLGTSPAIAAPRGGGYVAAMQSNAEDLWLYRVAAPGVADTNLPMDGNSSPAITAGR